MNQDEMLVVGGFPRADVSQIVESMLAERGESLRVILSVVERRKNTSVVARVRSGSDYVLKLSHHRSLLAHSPGPGVSLRKEKQVLDVLAGQPGLPVPVVHGYRVLSSHGRFADALLMNRLAGLPGASVSRRGGDGVLHALAEEAGRILRRIHGVRSACWGMITDARIAPLPGRGYPAAIAARAAEKTDVLSRQQLLDTRRLRPELDALAARSAEPRDYSLLHGDFSLASNNYLVDVRDRALTIVGVLDFEWARYGDPWEDLAKVCVNLPPPHWEALLRGYGVPSSRLDPSLFLKAEALRKAAWLCQRAPAAARAWLASDVARSIFCAGGSRVEVRPEG